MAIKQIKKIDFFSTVFKKYKALEHVPNCR